MDGDVDFGPDSVRMLVDRMKKNKRVGAACGRVHPIGSGEILIFYRCCKLKCQFLFGNKLL